MAYKTAYLHDFRYIISIQNICKMYNYLPVVTYYNIIIQHYNNNNASYCL